MPYLLYLKKQQNLKLSSAANYRWHFEGLSNSNELIQLIRPKKKYRNVSSRRVGVDFLTDIGLEEHFFGLLLG